MPEEPVPGVPGAPPTPGVETVPPAEPVQPVEPPEPTPPSPSPVPPVEEAKIPLSRLNEVIEQRKAAEAREARLLEVLQRQQAVQPTAQPQADPWEGLINHPDPATAQFYQQQKRLVEHAVQQGREQAFQEFGPVLVSLQQGQAAINLKEFRNENPDIKPGSEEEQMVVAYMEGRMPDRIRHPIESARNNTVVKRLEAENRALKSKQSSVGAKVAANVSEQTSGIPATTGLPGKPGDWRDTVRAAFRKGGDLADVLNAASARRET